MEQYALHKKEIRKTKIWSPYLMTLIMLYYTFTLIGNATVMKIVHFGPVLGVGGLFVIPLIFLIEDVIAEVYGYKISRLLIWLVLFSELIFSTGVLIIIHLPSPSSWHLQTAFDTVFDYIIRIGPIAIVAVMAGRFVNIYAITKFKILMKGKYFWMRSVTSTAIGGAITLSLYYGFGFWHKLPVGEIWHLALSDYSVRLIYAIIGGLPAAALVVFLKIKDNIDIYDINTNFNPFKLTLND